MTHPFSYLTRVTKTGVSIYLIWIVNLTGMIGISLGLGDWFLPKTPFNLLMGLLLLIWNFPPRNDWRSKIIWPLVFLIGMGVEVLGVNYGLLFGDYYYGENLGWKVLGVPLLIGVNWMVLTFLSAFISKQIFQNKWLAFFAGASLMVGLDFFIEPVAPVFDFWHWEIGHAPLQNFLAWFGVAFVLQILVDQVIPQKNHSFPYHHFAAQTVFFVFFYVFYQF